MENDNIKTLKQAHLAGKLACTEENLEDKHNSDRDLERAVDLIDIQAAKKHKIELRSMLTKWSDFELSPSARSKLEQKLNGQQPQASPPQKRARSGTDGQEGPHKKSRNASSGKLENGLKRSKYEDVHFIRCTFKNTHFNNCHMVGVVFEDCEFIDAPETIPEASRGECSAAKTQI